MSEVPEGWKSVHLCDLVTDYQAGFACGNKGVVGGLKHLRMNNISTNGSLDLSLTRAVPKELAGERHYLKKGDVVVCTTNSSRLVGKTAFFDLDGEFAFSNHLTRLRVDPNVCLPRFLYYYLLHYWKQNGYQEKCKHWVNQSTLPKEELLNLDAVLAPLNEQKRIVAKLDELLPKVEACKQRLEKVPQILKRFRQSVLAVTFGPCFAGEEDWECTNLGTLFDMANGRSLTHSKREAGTVPVFGGNGFMGTHSKGNHRGEMLIIGRVGAQCGNVHEHDGEAWITDNAICLTPKRQVNISFIRLALEFRRLNSLSGGTGQPYVSQEILNPLEIWVPSLEHQSSVVERFVKCTAHVSFILPKLDEVGALVQRTGDAVLASAFSGRLVSQDSNDKPASVLLTGIRETMELENSQGSKGRRKRKFESTVDA